MSESQHVQVYEVESIAKGIWNCDNIHPWVNINMEDCTSRDEYRLPSSEWSWVSNWKIDKEAGRTDKDGYEFASRYDRFSIKDRKPKPEKLWNDKSRRRLWVRTMRREMSAGISGTNNSNKVTDVIDKVRNGLATIHQARVKIEQAVLADPKSVSSEKRNHLIMAVRKNVDDISNMLLIAEQKSNSNAGKSGSNKATITMLSKLRRDCEKEKDAIEKALKTNGGDEKKNDDDNVNPHVFTKLSKGNKSTSLNFNYNTSNTNTNTNNDTLMQTNPNANPNGSANTRPTLMSGFGANRNNNTRGNSNTPSPAPGNAPTSTTGGGFNFGGIRSGSNNQSGGTNNPGGGSLGSSMVIGGKGASTFSLDQCANTNASGNNDALEVKDGHYMSHALQQKMIEQVYMVFCI